MDLDKLRELKDYFAGIPEGNIDQTEGLGHDNEYGICGCFGVHCDYALEMPDGSDAFRAQFAWNRGCDKNRSLLGLRRVHITAAWRRMGGVVYHAPDPYGTADWPHPVVETLAEIIRYEEGKADA